MAGKWKVVLVMNTLNCMAFHSKNVLMIIEVSQHRMDFKLLVLNVFDRIKYKTFGSSPIIITVNTAVSHLEIIHRDPSLHYSVQARAHLDICSSLPSHQHP